MKPVKIITNNMCLNDNIVSQMQKTFQVPLEEKLPINKPIIFNGGTISEII